MRRRVAFLTRCGAGALLALCGTGAAAADGTVEAGGRPLWEAGIAGGVARLPDYPGADRTSTRAIVLPMLVYRGPILRVDEQGVRGRLFESDDWRFDLSATAAFDARDNPRREGMPDLDYLFGVGPQWIYKGWQTAGRGPTLHLKLRAMMSTDFRRIDTHGWSFDPELRWRLDGVGGPRADLTLSLQPSWSGRALQRYLYEVTPEQATDARPAHAARAGYLGTEASATWTQRPAAGLSWFVTARLMSLHGAANVASPLLAERGQWGVGAGFIWTPWRSRERVAD
jgi:outer membrane scaffolding protein for murein synthesis (MipA/OmpV family)